MKYEFISGDKNLSYRGIPEKFILGRIYDIEDFKMYIEKFPDFFKKIEEEKEEQEEIVDSIIGDNKEEEQPIYTTNNEVDKVEDEPDDEVDETLEEKLDDIADELKCDEYEEMMKSENMEVYLRSLHYTKLKVLASYLDIDYDNKDNVIEAILGKVNENNK